MHVTSGLEQDVAGREVKRLVSSARWRWKTTCAGRGSEAQIESTQSRDGEQRHDILIAAPRATKQETRTGGMGGGGGEGVGGGGGQGDFTVKYAANSCKAIKVRTAQRERDGGRGERELGE